MSSIKPLAGYVVVKRIEEPSQTASGILLTESAKDKPQRGEVLAVGAAKEGVPQVAVGQIVLFKKYGPTELEVDGETVLLLEEDEIYAIVE
ncbi:MAG: chaperonin GroES [Oceanicoccus sp.]|jgi:chaperonin GroES